MDSTKPLLTVYVTNYNYGKYIEQCLESIIGQSFRDFELLIIDDGSTDNSSEVIDKYKNLDVLDITVIEQQNRGLIVSNNIALRIAQGKYIVRVDADDYLHPDMLMHLVNKLEEDPRIALAFADYYLVNEQGEIIAEEKRITLSESNLKDRPAHGACTVIRKEVLIESGGYSEEFSCQDGYDLWLRIALKNRVEHLSLPLFYYRQHGKSLTRDVGRILDTRSRIIKKHSYDLKLDLLDHLAIVPVRDIDAELALKEISGISVLERTIRSIATSELIKTIVVSTSSEEIIAAVEEVAVDGKSLLICRRPKQLGGMNQPIEKTVDYVLGKLSKNFDSIFIVSIEYPFRKDFYLDKALRTMYLFEAESVVSVVQESANFYTHSGSGLVPLNQNASLRLEREFVFRETGGIHGIRQSAYALKKKIVADRSTFIIVDELSGLRASSPIGTRSVSILFDRTES